MRVLASILLVSTVILGVHALADSDEGAAATAKRLEALELQVEYLRSREAAVSAYMLRNADRATAIEQMAGKMLSEGFTQRAIPPASRETLVNGLKSLAQDLKTDLPAVTEKEALLLKKAAAIEAE